MGGDCRGAGVSETSWWGCWQEAAAAELSPGQALGQEQAKAKGWSDLHTGGRGTAEMWEPWQPSSCCSKYHFLCYLHLSQAPKRPAWSVSHNGTPDFEKARF